MVARRQPSCVRHTLRRALRREPSVTAPSDRARCPARRTATLDRTAGSSCRRWKDLSPVFRATHAPRVTCRTFLEPDLPACRSSEQDQHSKGRPMNSKHLSRRVRLAAVPIAGLALLVAVASSAYAATAVGLGTADGFVVLAGQTITNTGATTLSGDVGLSPGAAITGFSTVTQTGTVHAADAVALGAQADLTVAYLNAAGQSPATALPTELGGSTLQPGVYSAGTFEITNTLTLDARGDPYAVFVFQSADTLEAMAGSHVALINDAKWCNVFWQVTSSATLNTTADFKGTILALTSIFLRTGATVEGRVLALSLIHISEPT